MREKSMANKSKNKLKNKGLIAKPKQEVASTEISKEELAKRSKDVANLCTNPAINASSLITAIKNSSYAGSFIHQLKQEKGVKLEHILEAVIDNNNKVQDGNLQEIESMLINQAKALDAIFYQYLGKTLSAEYMNQVQIFAQLALRSQNNCRNTLATLAEIKNPSNTTFVKQQNNAAIQLNNIEKVEVKNSENFEKSANELLEVKSNEWLDTGAQTAPVKVNSEMAAMVESRCED